MADRILLKNRNCKIQVSFIKKQTPEGETVDYDNLESVEIINFNNDIDKYIAVEDDKKKIKKEGKDDEKIEMTLDKFSLEKKRSFYVKLLKEKYNEIENVVILSGAGSSVDIGETNKGLTMGGLWDKMNKEKLACLKKLIEETNYAKIDKDGNIEKDNLIKDLELLLSRAGMKNIVTPNSELEKVIKEAREFIVKECTLALPKNSPHVKFLDKATLRPQKFPRVKIFTLNYDTLFEQAAAKEKFTVIDGFTFSNPRVFNGKYFDYDIIETRHNRQDKKDSTIGKLFYLFKMHGSLNWKKNNSEIEQFDGGTLDVGDRVMIFPQDSKYEHSYEQPYFEMMARFQQALRIENTLLITIGFSYLDKHISSVILESIKQNPSLNLLAFTYPEVVGQDKEYQKELHRICEIQSRVTLVAETFEDFANQFPENKAHRRVDFLEELSSHLKSKDSENGK